ncbi:hypothetical protein [Nostoc sp. 'Peltigera membranacea cyanobiont' 232]|uniref:hypothetical protein n=1 Tax=Nostoc sp. 'Peltigera membranacea cyanobiont' 232 TaxID=2014531 RepID=UPI000B95A522|nr:hypothetical protein [Nostoc sp. 'Peltigera membranacea cyanobiont' 232]OYE04195.1 hypothetical protein CDG79_14560 [Nostoc sp. 'Peltigera membranacea cyanobiont' 232]
MNLELEQKLWNAGKEEKAYSKETWYEIIDSLLDDFHQFVVHDFYRDSQIQLNIENPNCPSFGRWIWTDEKGEFPLSVTWSALIGGDIIGTEESGDIFHVSIVLFLFDTTGNNRLRLKTGESFLSFAFEKQSNDNGHWRSLGWCKDEWGEWENLG